MNETKNEETKQNTKKNEDWVRVSKRLKTLQKIHYCDSERKFALKMGLDPYVFRQIMGAYKPMSIKMATTLRDLCGVTLDWLYFGSFDGVDKKMKEKIQDCEKLTEGTS